MSEKLKTWLYTLVIVLVFLLLGLVIWLWYDYQLYRLDQEQNKRTPRVNETVTGS